MKIASYCFHLRKDQVGGAQVPAVAFMHWARNFGIACDLVTSRAFIPNSGISEDISKHYQVKIIDSEDELNEYDAVFFSTPDVFGGSNFDFNKITIPRASMAHAEFDSELYGGPERFHSIMSTADVPIVIGEGYWPGLRAKEKLWYPCTLPEYLLRDAVLSEADGIMYAARLSDWKNAHLLGLLSKIRKFRDSVHRRIHVYGKANRADYAFLLQDIAPKWTSREGVFSVYDLLEIQSRNSQYKFYWDVSGRDSYWFKLKRLNLAAVEALRYGQIPIAWKDQVPAELRNLIIPVENILSNPSYLHSISEHDIARRMEDFVENNVYTYEYVADQMQIIFEELGC